MTRQEHLLTVAAEECSEVAQRISKALRFGLQEVQSGHSENNRSRAEVEVVHLLATLEMLGMLSEVTDFIAENSWVRRAMDTKQANINYWLNYSKECKTLVEG